MLRRLSSVLIVGLAAVTLLFSGISLVPTFLVGAGTQATECIYGGATDRSLRGPNSFDPELVERPSRSPVVKVIRLTDDGELVDRCEWADALIEIASRPKPAGMPVPPNGAPNPAKLVVLYIHGWKHNGDLDDGDLKHFGELINNLTQVEAARLTGRQVVGVYVAWPGASVTWPVLEHLTFWDRKRAADRVSQSGIVTKLVGAISNIRRMRNNADDYIVDIGHSFGARVLYASTSQVLLYEVQRQHPGCRAGTYGKIDGPADLVMLLNPAFEASIYAALDSTTTRWQETYSEAQSPRLITIATTGDSATNVAFPLGQILDFKWRLPQRTTLGNFREYFTHELRVVPPSQESSANSAFWYDRYCSGNLCLRKAGVKERYSAPFMTVTTGPDVLKGHNEIWDPAFTSWLAAFIGATNSASRVHPASFPPNCG